MAAAAVACSRRAGTRRPGQPRNRPTAVVVSDNAALVFGRLTGMMLRVFTWMRWRQGLVRLDHVSNDLPARQSGRNSGQSSRIVRCRHDVVGHRVAGGNVPPATADDEDEFDLPVDGAHVVVDHWSRSSVFALSRPRLRRAPLDTGLRRRDCLSAADRGSGWVKENSAEVPSAGSGGSFYLKRVSSAGSSIAFKGTFRRR